MLFNLFNSVFFKYLTYTRILVQFGVILHQFWVYTSTIFWFWPSSFALNRNIGINNSKFIFKLFLDEINSLLYKPFITLLLSTILYDLFFFPFLHITVHLHLHVYERPSVLSNRLIISQFDWR